MMNGQMFSLRPVSLIQPSTIFMVSVLSRAPGDFVLVLIFVKPLGDTAERRVSITLFPFLP
jgi:hypothetical protein